jgi:chemotaxis protein CheD
MAPSESKEVVLSVGDYYFGGGNVRVCTLLGTCIAITIWHPVRRIGGMCHFLLPSRANRPTQEGSRPGMFAGEAMSLFAQSLRGSGTVAGDYSVKIAGGGNMFPGQMVEAGCRSSICAEDRRRDCMSIGCVNIRTARAELRRYGFNLTTEHVGGSGSRKVVFDLSSGDVWIKRGAAMTPEEQDMA